MKEQIIKEFRRKKHLTASRLVRRFGVSRQAMHRHLKELLRQGLIVRLGTSRKTSSYVLNTPSVLKRLVETRRNFRKRYLREGLEEEKVFREATLPPRSLERLSPDAKGIFHYALTEIVNNAVDHSGSKFVDLAVESNAQFIAFTVTDHGIGIFENIRSQKKLGSEMEGLQDLTKGKQTTCPERHSGEGLFFTSKAADRLVIESHKKRLVFDGRLNDIFISDIRFRKGTRVFSEIENQSRKKLTEIFREYTSENFQFQKSRITVKLFKEGESYMSRSQAKRILHALDAFTEIIMDFRDTDTIGQGFADEIFRVFSHQYPEIKIVPINCHENVQFMIDRARSTP